MEDHIMEMTEVQALLEELYLEMLISGEIEID